MPVISGITGKSESGILSPNNSIDSAWITDRHRTVDPQPAHERDSLSSSSNFFRHACPQMLQ